MGEHFSQKLSVMTGDEMHPHVAKHARRTVNPPMIHGLLTKYNFYNSLSLLGFYLPLPNSI
ncbi:DUF1054 family protein [Peribacillus simplex]|uniref:DUF1054 family protein n=1 Tax=Peribacillus simplex TaxID=1478 RepID=UPI003990108A